MFTYVSEIFEQPELLENQSKNWQNCFTNILPILEPKVENSTFVFQRLHRKGERYDAVGLLNPKTKTLS